MNHLFVENTPHLVDGPHCFLSKSTDWRWNERSLLLAKARRHDNLRRSFKIDKNNTVSEVAVETAAALASTSIVLKKYNPQYSSFLLHHAMQLSEFGDKYRGKYDKSVVIVKGYYPSTSGYGDELLWAALWLYKATKNGIYLDYVNENAYSLGGAGCAISKFSWDIKYVCVQVLAAKVKNWKVAAGDDHATRLSIVL